MPVGNGGDQLTDKQRLFCDEYLKDFNATRAYKSVYGGVKQHSAETAASRLLKNDEVQSYIDDQYYDAHAALIAEGRELRRFLTRCIRGEVTEEVVIQGGKITKGISIKDRLKCAAMLMKITNMRKDEPERKDDPLGINDTFGF